MKTTTKHQAGAASQVRPAGAILINAFNHLALLTLVLVGLIWPGAIQAQPTVTTLTASSILSTGATLNGSFIPGGLADAFFQLGTSTNVGLVASTLAGSGTAGFADGTWGAAQFNYPHGVATDAAGNLYVADSSNHRIRKVTPAGVVTTLAGSGTGGFADGTGASAQFNTPMDVAMGPDGNIYVADSANNRIRKVTPTGVVTTLAGNGAASYADGSAESAMFRHPRALTVDTLGYIYVADTDNNCIRKVTAAGVVTTLAGLGSAVLNDNQYNGFADATGTAARFSWPGGVAVDASGNVYVGDQLNNRIRKVTPPLGVVTTLAGSATGGFADGTGAAATFNNPCGLALDSSGNLLVADRLNKRVRKVTPAGVATTVAGSGTYGFADGPVATAQFSALEGVAVGASGNVYVADFNNHLIRMISPGPLPLLLAQSGLTGASAVPASLTVTGLLPATTYYYAAAATNSIGTAYGRFLTFTTLSTNASLADLTLSSGILSPIFASNTVSYTASVINGTESITVTPTVAQANMTVTVNGTPVTSGSASGPLSLVEGTNSITVAVTAQDGITLQSYTVAVTRQPALPTATTLSATAILSSGATLNSSNNPAGFADGFFQFGTSTNTDPVITVSTLAGTNTGGFADGTGAAAKFTLIYGTAVDGSGNVYVADFANQRIRKVTPAGVVTTLAGSGTQGIADGTGAAAQFSNPTGVAVDASGNVYVADQGSHRIRKVTPAGVVTTLAGGGADGSRGFADGTGTAARFYGPLAVAVDANGTVYVADTYNSCIRKVTPAGVVTTLAGTNQWGFADGTGSAARFNMPCGVGVDIAGNVYVADSSNQRIRKVTPAGVVTTLAGSGASGFANGTGAAAQFYLVTSSGLSVDIVGNVYVADTYNLRIRKVTPAGVVTTLAGSGTSGYVDGPGATARFYSPGGIAADASGNVYVGDLNVSPDFSRIRKIAQATMPLLLAQSGLTGTNDVPVSLSVTGLLPATTYYFRAATTNLAGRGYGNFLSFTTAGTNASLARLALSVGTLSPTFASNTLVYTASVPNATATITVTPTVGQTNMTVTVNATPVTSGSPSGPVSLALGVNTIAVVVTAQDGVTTNGYTVEVTRLPQLPAVTTMAASSILGTGVTLNARINPGGLADALFQYGTGTNTSATVLTLAGSGAGSFADGTGAAAGFYMPTGVAVDANGNGYVTDLYNQRIRKITPAGVVTTLAGSALPGFADGTGEEAKFFYPFGLAVDANGTVYVADTYNNRIRKITPAGVVTTLAGSGLSGFADGTGEAALFAAPTGVAVDANGNVYVADTSNNRIRKITPAGVVTTLAGSGAGGFAEGTGEVAIFSSPTGVAVDANGNVYVADTSNYRIRKVTPAGVVTTLAGSGTSGYADGTGAAARFAIATPSALAVDTGGNVYVADTSNNRIRKVTPAGVVTTLAGTNTAGFADGPAGASQLNSPTGVAVDVSGNVYIADKSNHRIRQLAPASSLTLLLAQSGMTGTSDVAVNLAVTGLLPQTTYYFRSVSTNAAGTTYGSFLSYTTSSTNASLSGLALSSGTLTPAFASNTVSYTASVANATTSITVTPTVAQANMTVTVNGTAVTSGTASGPVSLVVGLNTITVDVTAQDGVTTNGYTVAVTRLPEVPTATTLAATAILTTGATINSSINPGGYADALFEYGTSTNEGMVVTTFAGSAAGGFADGTGVAAKFNRPRGLAVDASGNFYVADQQNHCIRKVTPAGVVTTLAGSGTSGFADGPGAAAKFSYPQGVAVDASGNVYVLDGDGLRIRKVTPAGDVSTLAGDGTRGFVNGAGATAQFSNPNGIAVDGSGNVYVSDTGNQRIRKVTPAGVVTTFAGSGTAGFANGVGATAQFYNPFGVAVDASGNIYVSDTFNYRVRKVTPSGDVSTLAGSGAQGFADGPGATAQFDYPAGIVVDASGNVYVCEKNYNGVRKVTPLGDVTTLAGSGTAGFADGPVATARFNLPLGVAVDTSGNVYVADTFNNRIRKIALAVLPVVLAQTGVTGTGPVSASLVATGLLPETTYYYRAVAANAAGTNYGEFLTFTTLSTNATLAGLALSEGTLAPAFASNTLSYTASVPNATASITVTPTVAQANMTVTVNGTAVTSGTASGPVSLVVGLNTITVDVTAQDGVTTNGYTVAVTRLPEVPTDTTLAATAMLSSGATFNSSINPGGYADAFFQYGTSTNPGVVVSTFAGSTRGFSNAVGTAAQFNIPQRIAVDASGNIYVGDASNHRIRIVTPAGVVTTLAGSGTGGFADGPAATAQFYNPEGVAVAANGNVYVADKNNHRIRIVTPAGVVTTLAGSSTSGFADGTGAGARFNYPSGVAVDSSTNVYVADASNNRIRKVTPGGVVTTLAGDGAGAFADGTGAAARFSGPAGVAVDASGNIYVADQWNNSIRQVTPAGVVTTLAGTNSSGFADGTGAAARFNWPVGVAVDARGNVCVADYLNHRIRMVSAAGVVTTLAGSGTSGFADGPAATAKFKTPAGVAVDASGIVYVGDSGNDRIRKLAQGSLLLLLAQSGLAGTNPVPASLSVTDLLPETTYYFQSVATNLAGTAYGDFLSFTTLSTNASLSGLALSDGTLAPAFAANPVSYTVSVSNATASITVTPTVAQTNATVTVDGTSITSGTASGPVSLVVGPNTLTLAVTAQDGVTVRNYSVVVTRLAQAPAVTTVAATSVNSNSVVLQGLLTAYESTSGLLFEYGTSTNAGLVVTSLAGSGRGGFTDGTGAAARFEAPNGVALDADGNIYVADTSNHRIRKVTPAGVVTTLAGTNTAGVADGTGAAAQFNSLQGVAVGPDGNIYVADTGNNRIRKVTPAGVVTTVAGTGTSGFVDGPGATAQFSWPYGVAVDANTNIYVADYNNNRIRKVAPDGTVATLAGSSMGYLDGTGTGARFGLPAGVAVDASGNVYVADLGNQRIRKVTPAGVVTTLAGSGTSGFADGPAASAQFQWPSGVAVDASGNVYVGDPDNKRIRKLTPAGVVTTLAGSGTAGFADGPTATATFRTPKGVAVDASGAVYVGDTGNSLIRKIAMSTLPVVFAQSDIGGASPTAGSLSVSNLVPETTYYYRAIGTNVAGTNQGAFLTFRTLAVNQAPVLAVAVTNQAGTYASAYSYTFPVGTFTDPDGNTLTYTAYGLPGGITFGPGTRTFSGTPTAAGSNWVALVASDSFLTTTNTFSFVVGKAAASVQLAALSQTYSGTLRIATSTTTPSGLAVVVTYDGSTNAPTGAGSYMVVGTVAEANYAGGVTNTLTVDKAPLLVIADYKSRVYGHTNPVFTASYSGFVNNEGQTSLGKGGSGKTPLLRSPVTGSPSLTTAADVTSPVGTYTITAALGTLAASNYSFSFTNGVLTIEQAIVTVAADNKSRIYGSTNPVFTASYTGWLNTDSATVLGGAPSLTTTATTNSVVGTYTITAAIGTLTATNYSFAFTNGTLTVNKAEMSITANATNRVYGDVNPAFTGTVTGVVNSDNITGIYTTAATVLSPVATYDIVPSLNDPGSRLPNYTVTTNRALLTITKAAVTATADNKSRYYGRVNPALTITYTGLKNGDTSSLFSTIPVCTTPAVQSSLVGAYTITGASGVSSNYTFSYVPGTLTVTKAPLLVVGDDANRLYGRANPVFTAVVTGITNSDNITVQFSCPATNNSPVGEYRITMRMIDPTSRLGQYAVTLRSAILTVEPGPLAGFVSSESRPYAGTNAPFTVTYSGWQNGEGTNLLEGTIEYACTNNLGEVVDSTTAIGSYPIRVVTEQTATNYAVFYEDGTLTVTPVALTVTGNDATRVYGEANPTLTGTVTGQVNNDTISATFSTTATSGSAVGTYDISPVWNDPGTKLGNYTITTNLGTLTVTKAPLSVVVDGKSRTYGTANPTLTGTLTGVVNSDNITASYSTGAGLLSVVGSYPITASLNDPGSKLGNYDLTNTPATLTITKAPLGVVADNKSRTYGTANPTLTASYSGFVNSENATALGGSLSLTTEATASSPTGTYTITASGYTSGNYDISYTNGTLTVGSATLTVSGDNKTRVYGAANPALTGSLVGVVSGDSITAAWSTLATNNSAVGEYTITPVWTDPDGKLANYTINTNLGTLTITKGVLTVTADNQSRGYGDANPTLTMSYSGFAPGDSAASLTTQPTCTVSATPTSAPALFTITPSGATSPNYTISYVNGTLTVGKALLVIIGDDANRPYGQTNPVFTASIVGVKNGDNLTFDYQTDAIQTSLPGRYYIEILIGDADGKLAYYDVVMVGGLLTVKPAVLTGTIASQTRGYGANNSPFTVAYSGFITPADTNLLTGTLVLTAKATGGITVTSATAPGSYAIKATGKQSLTNYTVTYVDGSLTITQAVLTITGNNATRVYGSANPTLTASTTGFVNGQTTSVLGGSLSVDTTATVTSPAGSYAVTPSGYTSVNYAIHYVDGALTVTKAPLAGEITAATRAYGQNNPAYAVTYTGFLNGDTTNVLGSGLTFSCVNTNTTLEVTNNTPIGSYVVKAATPPAATNYSITIADGSLTITQAVITITADNKSRAYGASNPTLTGTLNGVLNGDNITAIYGTTAVIASPAGTYDIVPGLVDPSGKLTNYTSTLTSGTLTVGKAPLAVTADNQNRAYGTANPTLTVSYVGFLNGDTAANLGGTLSVTTPATASSLIGTYGITASGQTSTNYDISYTGGTLTIGKGTLTATADNLSRSYGSTNPALTGTLAGVAPGDNIAVSYGTAVTQASGVGAYAIVTTLSDPDGKLVNYNVSKSDGTLTVNKATLVVRAEDRSRIYGSLNPHLTLRYSGFVNGESTAVLTSTPTSQTTATTASPVGTYDITVTGGSAANYDITRTSGTLTINKAAITVIADDKNRSYGVANPTLTGTLSGVLNGDNITAFYGTTAILSSPAGTYAIVPGLLDPTSKLGNYTTSLTNGTLTVKGDDAPVVTLTNTPWLYTVGTAAALVDTNATVTDGGSPNFDGGTLTVWLSANGNVLDTLSYQAQGEAAGQIGQNGTGVTYGGALIATVAGGTGTTPLVFSLNTNATPAAVQALLRAVTIETDDESTNSRTMRVVVADGDGGISAPVTKVLALNRPPVAGPDSYSVAVNGTLTNTIASVIANDTDADGDIVVFESFSGVSANGGRIIQVGTDLIYRAPVGYRGQDLFAYLIADGRGGEAVGVMTVNVGLSGTLTLNNSVDGMMVHLVGEAGKAYRIEATGNMFQWSVVGSAVANPDGTIEVLDTHAKGMPQRFYRAVEE